MSVRQNLPVIIHPKGLAKEPAPWKRLRWSHTDQNLTMRNDSPYIVRLSSVAKLLPSEQEVNLGRTYILPGEKLDIAVDDATAKAALQKSTQVEIFPATVYGYAVDKFDAPIENTTNAVENVVTAQASKIE